MNQAQGFISTPLRASDMIDTDVVSPQGDSIGEVKEVVIDPNTGRVAYAVVSFGGFLGMGEKDVAISFENLKFAKDNDNDLVVTTNVTKETLQATPAYTKPKQ